MNYKQCELSLNNNNVVGWIEERGAKLNALVEMSDGNFWKVEKVYDNVMTKQALAEKQRMDRNSLKSIQK